MTEYTVHSIDGHRRNALPTLGEAKICAHLNLEAALIYEGAQLVYDFDFRACAPPDVIIVPRYDFADPAQRREEKYTGTTYGEEDEL